jgi:hypothetical protein
MPVYCKPPEQQEPPEEDEPEPSHGTVREPSPPPWLQGVDMGRACAAFYAAIYRRRWN